MYISPTVICINNIIPLPQNTISSLIKRYIGSNQLDVTPDNSPLVVHGGVARAEAAAVSGLDVGVQRVVVDQLEVVTAVAPLQQIDKNTDIKGMSVG